MKALRRLLSNTTAASSAEYALIAAIIGTGIAAAAFALGQSVATSLNVSGDEITTCTSGTC